MRFEDKDTQNTENQLRNGGVIRNGEGKLGQKGQKGQADSLALYSYRIQSFVGDIPGMASADGLIDLVAHTSSYCH